MAAHSIHNRVMKVSVIIPVLNERENLDRLLGELQGIRAAGHEIIVVDGGSHDGSTSIAQGRSDKFIRHERGRGIQMNAGAYCATGEVLLFLHADTRLPPDFLSAVQAACNHNLGQWGFFRIRLSGNNRLFRIIDTCMNLRSRFTGIATGDQCLFVTKQLFREDGGYEEIPIMEDIALCRRLKRTCQPVVLSDSVTTSSRRWQQQGAVKTIISMWVLRLAYYLGISPSRLVRFYYG